MENNYEYTINDLLEEAINDPNWEPDAEKRETLVNQLKTVLINI